MLARPRTTSPTWIALAVDDVVALDDADAEAGHVVVAGLVEVGQDGRLAADEGAVGLQAAVADALDQVADQGGSSLGMAR